MPLWVYNYEAWLTVRGFDRLLVRHNGPFAEALNTLWQFLLSSEFRWMIGGALGALLAEGLWRWKNTSSNDLGDGYQKVDQAAVHEKINTLIERAAFSAGSAMGGSEDDARMALPPIKLAINILAEWHKLPKPSFANIKPKRALELGFNYVNDVGTPAQSGDIDGAKEAAERLSATDAKTYSPIAKPTPLPPVEKKPEFSYPYPKAVLQIAVKGEKGTRTAAAGRPPEKARWVFDIEKHHDADLRGCAAFVVGWTIEGHQIEINQNLKVGKAHTFDVLLKGCPRQAVLMARDISDQVSRPPFVMHLESGDVALSENTTYIVEIELRCAYPHPTVAHIQIDTGTGLDATIRLIDQAVRPL